MASTLKELKSVANAVKSLHTEIRMLRKAGKDKKTDAIEKQALNFIAKLENAAINASSPGEGSSDDLIAILKAEKKMLSAHLKQRPPFAERINTRAHLQEIQFMLGAVKIGKTLTWDGLLSPAELDDYKADLKTAAQEVRRRRKLQSLLSSIFNIGIMAVNLTTKIATLGV